MAQEGCGGGGEAEHIAGRSIAWRLLARRLLALVDEAGNEVRLAELGCGPGGWGAVSDGAERPELSA